MFASFDQFAAQLRDLDQSVDDAVRVDRIRELEQLKALAAAAQARETAAFADSQRARQNKHGVAVQVALARRVSPFEASRYVNQVSALTADLPGTFAKLMAGAVSERRALLVAREIGWLSPAHRRAVDAQVAPALERLGTRRLLDTVRRSAYELDRHAYLQRLEIAESERHVSLRPVADNMARLTAVLPLVQAVSAYAALRAHATATAGVGTETRSRSQLMADALVERVTGQAHTAEVPLQVSVIMTDQTLLDYGDGNDRPATIAGLGMIPADLARRAVDEAGAVFLRKFYAAPRGGLAAMESRSRCFTDAQRTFLVARDQVCRTPWCDAPIRHADHVVPVELGGRTAIENGQGLCEACNYAKSGTGWHHTVDGDDIVTETPTGHTYRSRAPAAA